VSEGTLVLALGCSITWLAPAHFDLLHFSAALLAAMPSIMKLAMQAAVRKRHRGQWRKQYGSSRWRTLTLQSRLSALAWLLNKARRGIHACSRLAKVLHRASLVPRSSRFGSPETCNRGNTVSQVFQHTPGGGSLLLLLHEPQLQIARLHYAWLHCKEPCVSLAALDRN